MTSSSSLLSLPIAFDTFGRRPKASIRFPSPFPFQNLPSFLHISPPPFPPGQFLRHISRLDMCCARVRTCPSSEQKKIVSGIQIPFSLSRFPQMTLYHAKFESPLDPYLREKEERERDTPFSTREWDIKNIARSFPILHCRFADSGLVSLRRASIR